MAEKIPFLSSDLNGNGKTGWGERLLALDPGIRAGMGLFRMIKGANQPQKAFWEHAYPSRSIQRQNFGLSNMMQPQDFQNSFSAPNGGLSYGKTDPWSNPYKRQDFGLTAQQPQQQAQDMFDPNALTQFGNTGLPMNNLQNMLPRQAPTQMPVRNDLDFMDTQGAAYQSRFAPSYANPMQSNNGYFDMNKAGTANGNWVQGVGWRTDANKAFGQTEEDMAFNAQMAQALMSKGQ